MLTGLWGIALVLAYPTFPVAYAERIQSGSLILLGVYVVASAVLWLAVELPGVRASMQQLALWGFVFDLAAATTVSFAFGFDRNTAVWIILFLVPVEGAMRFQLRGTMVTLAVSIAGYIGREFAWSRWLPDEAVDVQSIIFRMTVVAIVATFVGLISEQLRAEREVARTALAKVQRSDEWRSHLVTALGHDVRSPLATIEMQAKALGSLALDDEQRDQMYLGIARQARRLSRLADGLLDMAIAEQADLTLAYAEVEVEPLVNEVVELLGVAAHVEVDIAPDLRLHADADRLTQVVLNLVSNARKYGLDPIQIGADQQGDDVVFVVRDHGSGIPEAQRERLFDAFTHGDGPEATGLGLYLVTAIVAAHGGTVAVEDGKPGARFIVRLPRHWQGNASA